MFQVYNHRIIGPKAGFLESPNHGAKFESGFPDSIIIHYTACEDAASAIHLLSNPDVPNRVSAHIVVGRDNSVTQLVLFNTIAWHAGESAYEGRSGYNRYSIGIEIDNAGEMTKSDGIFVSRFKKEYSADEVLALRHRNHTIEKYWHAYTADQIKVVTEICEALIMHYPITSILGHEEISPLRKDDPGPAFPLDEMRGAIFSQARSSGRKPVR